MLTMREAKQRMSQHNARLQYDKYTREYRVTLNEWPMYRVSTEERAYYTDDIEDAVLTAGAMRREAARLSA